MANVSEDLDRRALGDLFRRLRGVDRVGERIERVSREWVGRPYRECPLGGAPGRPEVFTASIGAFDCVTFVECVLAVAVSDSVEGFVANLRAIRYRDGDVAWKARNHYMTGWIRENQRAGFVRNRTRGPAVVRRERLLDVVPGAGARTVRVASIPKDVFRAFRDEVATGDLTFFASTRRHLDVFHCGILVRDGAGVRMRHAASSRGRVVDEELGRFLSANRMVGVILVRPEEAFPRAA
jgi:hypothetical protein